MQRILTTLNRYMPLLIGVMVVVMVLQFALQHSPSNATISAWWQGLARFLHAYGWFVLAAALVLWMLAGLCVLREADALPAAIVNWRWFMDVLDRLTNKLAIEDALAKEEDAVFLDAAQLASALKAKVIGQDAVCEDLAAQLRRRLALRQRGKPVGVFLFAGPPGTGKTFLAKRLAHEMQRRLLHLDMTQFRGGHAGSQLFGMTKGYVGSDSYGLLTAGLRDVPESVVLLDEIEKAHGEVHKAFLTAWNDGFITEASDGKHIATTKAVFVLTTNAATDALAGLSKQFSEDADALRAGSVNALKEAGFAPEVLNRIDRIFVFKPLEGLDVARVCALEMEAMIESYGLEVAEQGIEPEVIVALMRRYKKLGSAASSRDLVRAIEESMADSLIEAKQRGAAKISLTLAGDRVVARAIMPGARAA